LSNNSAIFPGMIVTEIADIYLEGQLKPEAASPKKPAETMPPAIALPEKEALRYPGYYASPESRAAFKLALKDGKLINSGLLQNEIPMVPISENRFVLVANNNKYELTPVFNQSGAISEIKLTVNGGKPDIFLPVKPPFDSPQQLAEYAGTYYSDELDADYKLTLKGNNLILQVGESLEAPLTAAYADVFTIEAINLSFTRDNQGKITGFVFNTAVGEREVKGITFKRQ
jgi:hypothetical protein